MVQCLIFNFNSLMVIRFVVQNRENAVNLLGEYGPDDLVREGHLRERKLLVGTLIDLCRKTVGASDDKDEPLQSAHHAFAHPLGKINRPKRCASLVEQDDVVAFGELGEDALPLALVLLLGGEALRIAQVGQHGNRETAVVVDALLVHLHKRTDLLRIGLANHNQLNLHSETMMLTNFEC